MAGSLFETTVGEVCQVFDGPHATPTRLDSGPVFLGITSLNKGRIDLAASDHVSEEDFAKWTRRVTPKPGDVAFKALFNYLRDRIAALRSGEAGGDHKLTVYLPSGTYLVSDTLVHDGTLAKGFCYLRLIGQDRANTIIRLKNNAPGFGAGAEKAVLPFTKLGQQQGNIMWGNQLRNITIDTGSGNPGAVGVVFLGANGCSMDNVTIRSGDGTGHTALSFPTWSVQGHFTDLSLQGFDYGIRCINVVENNPTFENVTVSGQRIAGVHIDRVSTTLRNLRSQNTVPAVSVSGDGAHVVLLDSELTGGSGSQAAVVLADSNKQQLFMRKVTSTGYGASLRMNGQTRLTGYVAEFVSGSVFAFRSNVPRRSMDLPIEDVRLVPWESNPGNWASPEDYTGTTEQRIQAALNSGKPAVYFPKYYFVPNNVILKVPATVRQLEFLHQDSWIWGGLEVHQASTQPLWIEHCNRKMLVRVSAPRPVHGRFVSMSYEVTTTQPVTAHFQNAAVLANAHRDTFCPSNVRVYARSINEEARANVNFLANGGLLWVMGFKTEADRPAFVARNNGVIEVLGGYQNMAAVNDTGQPMLFNQGGHVSFVGCTFNYRNYQQAIWETAGSTTNKLRAADLPQRITTGNNRNYTVPLFVGYDEARIQSYKNQGPAGFLFAADENGSATYSQPVDLAYGASGKFAYLVDRIGTVRFDNATFGDPIPGVKKKGYFRIPGGTGLAASYFNRIDLTGSPALQRTDAVVDFNWGGSAPTAGINKDNISVRWTGSLEPPVSGNYILETQSDDGIRLWLNNQLVINQWNDHAARIDRSAPQAFTARQRVSVRLEYYERGGSAVARLRWIVPGTTTAVPIPKHRLFPTAP